MRRSTLFSAAALILSAGFLAGAEPNNGFFFKKGDRIVFLGDSITEQYQYSSYIELYLTTRFPKWNLTFINAGIGGDTATGGAGRFAAHVLAEKPTAVTIDFGMNDGGYGGFNTFANRRYVDKTTAMLEMARKAGVRVALISPNAVDRRAQPGFTTYFETQQKFYAPLQGIAAKFHVPFVDQYDVTAAAIKKMEAEGPKAKQVRPFPDGIHTSPHGALLMAHTILTGLHAPALVSDVEIDVAGGKATPKACSIDKLKATTTEVEFDRSDDCIPLPVLREWLPILPYVNDLKDLNWYGLKITGLVTGNYQVQIDGKDAATFTAEQLQNGVNLGTLASGPIFDQGRNVVNAVNAKNKLVYDRFRGVVMFQAPEWLSDVAAQRKPKELARRMAQIDQRQAEIYKMAQPTPHHFQVKQVN
jgi:lysophospholipase L1-like esterase